MSQAGKVKALGVASLKRAPSLPQAPAIAESALPGFEVEIWFGVAAPAKTPPDIVARLAKEIEAIMALPDVKERTAKFGLDVAYAGSERVPQAHRRRPRALRQGDPRRRHRAELKLADAPAKSCCSAAETFHSPASL